MKVLYGDVIGNVYSIIIDRAKYQKIMIVYDDYTSSLLINDLYSRVKGVCIFNKSHINNLDIHELNNGYKLIVYLCLEESYLKRKFEVEEFINVFCLQDKNIVPFLIGDKSTLLSGENYLLLERKTVDACLISSISCNRFVEYFQNLLNCDDADEKYINFENNKINFNLELLISNISSNMNFYDYEILVKSNLDCKSVVLIDLILIDAFMVLLNAVKTQSLMIVDVYKSGKEDMALIDKCYSIIGNDVIKNVILLNYSDLWEFCSKTKQNILSCVGIFNYTKNDFQKSFDLVKSYLKQNDNILSILYIYNIFGV